MMPVLLISRAWMLLAMIVAVRQALDYTSTWRAIAVCLVGWLLTSAIILALGAARRHDCVVARLRLGPTSICPCGRLAPTRRLV
jgi:hypothetical protein